MVITSSGVVIRQSRQSFWQRRTKFERFAIISLPICIVLLLILTIHLLLIEKGITIKQIESEVTTEDRICLTPGCIQTAAETLKFIDQSIDPCDNFYEFACGGYLKTTRIPDNETKIDMFIDLKKIVQNQLRSILEEPIRADEPKSYTLYKSMYSACMNTTAIDLDSINFLKTMIKDLGGWPVLEEFAWNDKKFDWQKSIYKFRKFGLSTNNFITFSVVPNPKNSSKNILQLKEPNLELNREYLLNGVEDKIVQAYINYMVELAQHFGANRSYAQSEVLEIIYFKMKLAQIGVVIEQDQEQNQNLTMTIRELQEKHPNISWLDIINYVVSLPDQALKNDNLITIKNPYFISNLEALLRETPKRVQANHAIFQAITSLVFTLPESIRNLERKFNREIHGTSSVLPRWKECVAISSTSLNLVAGSLYVQKYFKETSQHSAKEVVTSIKKEFVKSFQNLEWIDNDTKKLAIEKFEMLRINVGYSKEYLNLTKIEDHYSDLNINTTNYLLFIGNYSLFKTDQVFSELFNAITIDGTDWKSRLLPTEVNISYSLRKNSIDIPAAILQQFLFKTDRIQSMNYGTIGSMVGHEISHGFDIEGKRYDKNGNLNNWWKKTTDIAYTKKINCFINQYSNFTEPEVNMNLNGKNTQAENVADNAGIKHAYLAYQAWVKQNGEEPHLPGLNYSAQQIFWISAAHTWCNKERDESLKQSISHDNYSPGKFRVLVSFSNSEFFSEDFSCPLGSNMNPHKKCKMW